MRKNAKSWLIKFMMVIIAVVFIFYFGYSFTSDKSGKVASVNGEVITSQEYDKTYNQLLSNLQSQYGEALNENMIKSFDLKTTTLNALLQQKVVSQEAERIGLDITESELRDMISQNEAFHTNGSFDNTKYNALLANNDLTTEAFEKSTSQSLLNQKLNQFLSTFLVLSDQEVKDQYIYSSEQVRVSFVTFSPDDFISSVNIDDTLMNKYFEDHKETYRIPPKIKIAYISISPDKFRDQVKVMDEDIKTYYENNIDSFWEKKQVKASHILFYLANDATVETEKAVREKAAMVLEKAKAGDDFAKLAKEYSEDTYTKDKGGDLGYFTEGDMVDAFEDASFSLRNGEISDLVRTPFGYHIIKVYDVKEARLKELQEVRDQIAEILISNESNDLAKERAWSLIDRMPYDADLVEYASKMGVASAITDYFSEENPIYLLKDQTKILDTIFSLQTKEISDVLNLNNSYCIVQVVDKKDSYLPDIGDVKAQVEEDYREYLAGQKSKAAAEEYLSKLRGGSDWDMLAGESGRTPQTTGFFTRLDYPEETGYIRGLQKTAFNLNADKRYPDIVLENETASFIIRWEEKKGIDEEKYREERDAFVKGILSAKQQYISRSWLSRLMNNAEIDTSGFERNK